MKIYCIILILTRLWASVRNRTTVALLLYNSSENDGSSLLHKCADKYLKVKKRCKEYNKNNHISFFLKFNIVNSIFLLQKIEAVQVSKNNTNMNYF